MIYKNKKRILFIVEAMGGGVFTYTVDLANELSKTYNMYVAYAERPQTPVDFKEYFDPAVELIEVKNFSREINPIMDIKAVLEVRRIAKVVKPDIIHLHSSKAGVVGRIAFSGKNIPLFYTPHGYSFLMENYNSVKRYLFRFIESIMAKRRVLISNAILAVTGLVLSFVLPKSLSMLEYAEYQQYLLYVSYINICHLGIASGMFLNYAGKKMEEIQKGRYKSEIYLILIVLSSFTIIGLAASGISKSKILILTTITIIPQCLNASFQAIYQAWNRFLSYAIVNALPRVLLILSFGMLVLTSNINGDNVILCSIAISWGITLYFLISFFRFTNGVESYSVFSRFNLETTCRGFLITLGNYVNQLFHSIDKQFVLSLYSKTSFAMYSFAMSTQSIMMIFIMSLATPFYPRLARDDVDAKYILRIKELLFAFGAYSGCAYFIVSFVVEWYISEYVDSLGVCAIFFAVFPAMAIINVLYINLYRIKRKLKKYILTLVGILVVAAVANMVAVFIKGDYLGIALASSMKLFRLWS